MGSVHLADDARLQRKVAIKFIRTDRSTPNAVERFEREALSVGRFGHPHIVRVLDFHREGDAPYLVMEYLEGESLSARLRRGPLEAEEAVRIHLEILSAISEANRAGVLHRDIKPGNIFLHKSGEGVSAKLLDFGLAYLLEEQKSTKLTATGITVGTPAFMAPERIMGLGLDPRSDLYSLGVSLYRTLCGELPFTGPDLQRKAMLHDARTLRIDGTALDPVLDAITRKAMEKLPGARYQSAEAMAEALRAWQTAPRKAPAREDAAKSAPPSKGPSRRVIAAAAVLLIQLTALATWLFVASSADAPETSPGGAAAERSATPRSEDPRDEIPALEAAPVPSAENAIDEAPESGVAEAVPAAEAREALAPPRRRRGAAPTRMRTRRTALAEEAADLPETPIEPDWSQARTP